MASKRRIRRNACTGKKRYASEREALTAVMGMRRAGGTDYLTPYRCKFCNAFHFGHPPRRVQQALAA